MPGYSSGIGLLIIGGYTCGNGTIGLYIGGGYSDIRGINYLET